VTTLLDPTGELRPAARERVARLDGVAGRRLVLLDISKARGDVFLDRVAELLEERGAVVGRARKPTFTKPAPEALRAELAAGWDAVVEGLAD
jgi:hypothetical protein